MSGGGRRIGGTIWLFTFILLASAGGIAILGAAAGRGATFEPYSTFRAEPDGASAVHEMLAYMGYECRRETEELVALPDDGSLLVLIHPAVCCAPTLLLPPCARLHLVRHAVCHRYQLDHHQLEARRADEGRTSGFFED